MESTRHRLIRSTSHRDFILKKSGLALSSASPVPEKCILFPPIQGQSMKHVKRMSFPNGSRLMKECNLSGFLGLNRFKVHRTIGTGSSARVRLATDRLDNQPVVLKRLSKSLILKRGNLTRVLSEKNMLKQTQSPFVIALKDTFQDTFYLYFVLEYVQGGELYKLLEINNGHLDREYVKLCASEVVCALSYLHTNEIVYRDLKPENILITSTGHIKLADLGYAKHLQHDEETFSFCGTPEYLAPEVIGRTGHSFACDWWQFGILMYEMLVGHPPFKDETPYILYESIVTDDVHFPSQVTLDARSLISSLLIKDPQSRATEAQVRSHLYFAGMSWEDVEGLRTLPHYKPKVKDALDANNFDAYEEKDLPVDERKLTDPDLFRDF